jgi:hypothetical protein
MSREELAVTTRKLASTSHTARIISGKTSVRRMGGKGKVDAHFQPSLMTIQAQPLNPSRGAHA